MRIVHIEGDESDPDKDGTAEGMHISESCDLCDAWAVVPVECYEVAYPDVDFTRILALIEGQNAAGVVWLVNPPYGDEDQTLAQVDFGKSSKSAFSGGSRDGGSLPERAAGSG